MKTTRELRVERKDARRAPTPDRSILPGKPGRKKRKEDKPFHVRGASRLSGKVTTYLKAKTQLDAENWIDKQKRSVYISEDPALKALSQKLKHWCDSLHVVDVRKE